MSQFGFIIINFTLMILLSSVSSAPTASEENTMKELYDYLLQREYAEPLSLDENGMERKVIRTPSMRLRFGRTDPNLSLFRKENYIENEIQSKPIRSPSMRLRFGRRSDPMMPLMFDENSYGNEAMSRKYQRTPSVRLRFGKRDSPNFNDDEENTLHNDDAVAQMMNHTQEN